jgi:predicted small secreted protein
MKKTEWFAILVLLLLLLFMLTGCNTVAGIGKDITGIADVAKEKVTQSKQESAK